MPSCRNPPETDDGGRADEGCSIGEGENDRMHTPAGDHVVVVPFCPAVTEVTETDDGDEID